MGPDSRQAPNTHSDLLSLAVVIPTLNEEQNIQAAIASVAHKPGVREVIVVDGGSSDKTVALARASGAKVLNSQPGRGKQLNVGWRASKKAEWCLFLHADTKLPAGFGQLITDAVTARERRPQQQQQRWQHVRLPGPLQALHDSWQQLWNQHQQPVPCVSLQRPCQQNLLSGKPRQPPVWGCFSSIQLDQVPLWQSWLLQVAVGLRTRVVHQPYGDQGLFVRKSTLQELGGYKEWMLLEDYALVQQLNKLSPPAVVPRPVVTSGRLYKAAGFWEVVAVHQRILYEYTVAGTSPDRLQQLRAQLLNKQDSRCPCRVRT